MPHAALWVVQRQTAATQCRRLVVSMPHAALWVVQPVFYPRNYACRWCFNAARGFVGGAASARRSFSGGLLSFNAARGFVGGAAIK